MGCACHTPPQTVLALAEATTVQGSRLVLSYINVQGRAPIFGEKKSYWISAVQYGFTKFTCTVFMLLAVPYSRIYSRIRILEVFRNTLAHFAILSNTT